jgi:hypothetical protein
MAPDVEIAGIRIQGWRGFAVLAASGLAIAAVARELSRPREQRRWTGSIAGVPYDFRAPTVGRLRRSVWDPEDRRVLTPHAFGMGWGVNLAEVSRRTRLYRRHDWQPVNPLSEDDIRQVVHETLEDNPTAGLREVLAAWRVRRGVTVDDAEAARVADVFEREAAAWHARGALQDSGPEVAPSEPRVATDHDEPERLAS